MLNSRIRIVPNLFCLTTLVTIFLVTTPLPTHGNEGFSLWARYLDGLRNSDRDRYYQELDRLMMERPEIYDKYVEPLQPPRRHYNMAQPQQSSRDHGQVGGAAAVGGSDRFSQYEGRPSGTYRGEGSLETRVEKLEANFNDRMTLLEQKVRRLSRMLTAQSDYRLSDFYEL